jgi:hypothetical protein
MALPPLKVKIGAETDDLDKGLSGAEASLARFAKVGVASAAAVGAAMVALTKKSMENIDVLAKQARSLGLTTAAFQRMTMVAGEAGVESGKLSSMLGLMQRNIVELSNGTQAQVDSFKALGVSLADLQGLSPDEQFAKIAASLDAIGDPAEKTALAMEVFGRAGRDAINMLSDYSGKAAEAAKFQNDFGIAVSQVTSDNVEAANDAVGRLGMVMEGFGNTMAGIVAPSVESAANAFIAWAQSIYGAEAALDGLLMNADRARAILGDELADALIQNKALIAENEAGIKNLSYIYEGLARDVGVAVDSMAGDISYLVELGFDDLAIQINDVSGEMETLQNDLNGGRISAEEFETKMADAIVKATDLLNDANAIDGVDMSSAIGQVGLLAGALGIAKDVADSLRRALPGGAGAAPLPTPNSDRRVGTELPVWGETSNAPTTRPNAPGVNSYGDFLDAGTVGTSGAGISSADKVREDMAARLEALMEGMMTEQETVANWYEENRLLLEDARAAELLTEEEFQDHRERLEKEHQDRLSKIKEMGAAASINTVLGAGAEILNAMGSTNKKALKIAKVFGAAQALIGAYQGAAEALKLPFPQNLAAAATILAKGIGFVSAIKSVNDSGGAVAAGGSTGGGGGASAAPAAASAQAPATTFAFTLQNDPMGFGESFARQMIEQLNATQRNGGQIRGVMA